MTADIFAGRRSTYLQCGFFAVSPNTRRVHCSVFESSKVQIFVDDFEIPVAKTHTVSGGKNHPILSIFR
jgi:hypothetical protein